MICTLSYGCNYSQLINNYPSLPLELETADIKQDILALAAFFLSIITLLSWALTTANNRHNARASLRTRSSMLGVTRQPYYFGD